MKKKIVIVMFFSIFWVILPTVIFCPSPYLGNMLESSNIHTPTVLIHIFWCTSAPLLIFFGFSYKNNSGEWPVYCSTQDIRCRYPLVTERDLKGQDFITTARQTHNNHNLKVYALCYQYIHLNQTATLTNVPELWNDKTYDRYCYMGYRCMGHYSREFNPEKIIDKVPSFFLTIKE